MRMTMKNSQKSELLNENLGFESILIDELEANKIEVPDAEQVDQLIEELYQYVPQPGACKSLKLNKSRIKRFYQCISFSIKGLPWYYFLIALLICALSLILAEHSTRKDILYAAILLPPLPVAGSLLLFECTRDKKMAEFLMTCLFDYKQLVTARLFAASLYSFGINLGIMLCLLHKGITMQQDSLIFCLSYAGSLIIALLFIRRLSGMMGSAVISVCWVTSAGVCSIKSIHTSIYQLSPLILIFILSVCIFLMIWLVRKIPGKIQRNLLVGELIT